MADVDLSSLAWRKSLASDETNCVEIAAACGLVMIRDSKNTEGGALAFSPSSWVDFVKRVRPDTSRAPLLSTTAAYENESHDASESGRGARQAALPGPVCDHVGTRRAKVRCER
jgi:Domain of unknown function (DUF397)